MITIDSVWSCILALLASVGGIGVVVCAIVKFCSDTITEKLSKSYQLKMDKELEKYKQNLENKKYVTQTQYDIELSVYRDLTKSLFLVVKIFSEMLDDYLMKNMSDKELLAYEIKKGEDVIEGVVSLQDKVFENAPFIPKHLFEKYEYISQTANDLLKKRIVNLRKLVTEDDGIKNIKYIMSEGEKDKARHIIESYEELNKDLREYLRNIRIVE